MFLMEILSWIMYQARQFLQIFIKFYIFQQSNILMFYNSESVKIFGPEIDTFQIKHRFPVKIYSITKNR
jgi:hypothetical protein